MELEEEEIYDDIDVQVTTGFQNVQQNDPPAGGLIYTGLLSQSNDNVYDVASRPQSGADYMHRVDYRLEQSLQMRNKQALDEHASVDLNKDSINLDSMKVTQINKEQISSNESEFECGSYQVEAKEEKQTADQFKGKCLFCFVIFMNVLSFAASVAVIVCVVLWMTNLSDSNAQLQLLLEMLNSSVCTATSLRQSNMCGCQFQSNCTTNNSTLC